MQILELASRLEPLGLTEKEARVYVAALFLGPSPVQRIASQADVNRATAYVILDQLAEYGLVSQSQEKNKTVYVAEPPETLGTLFTRQQHEIELRRQELDRLLPDLQSVGRGKDGSEGAPVVRFFKGQEGVVNINGQMIKRSRPGSTLYSFSDFDDVLDMDPEELGRTASQRVKKKIAARQFYSFSKELPSDPGAMRETKRLPSKMKAKADIMLFEGKAVMQSYPTDPHEAIGVIIESPEIVGALRQLYEVAWDHYRPSNKKSVN
jgi:sugar-specific transcriptional regulator TrmB